MIELKIVNDLPPYADTKDIVAIDIEMFGQQVERLHRPHGEFGCISIMFDGENTVYQVYDPQLIPDVLEHVRPAEWVLVNALYDFRQLRRWDRNKVLSTPHTVWDCMLVEQNLFGGYFREFSMADMVRRYYDVILDKSTRDQFSSANHMTQQMKQYAAEDVYWTLKIRQAQWDLGRDMSNYRKIDMPMIWPLLDILPVKVDQDKWRTTVADFVRIAAETEGSLGINTKSVPQVKKALLDEGFNVANTQAKTLEALAGKSKFVDTILKARKYRDVSSRWGENWLKNAVEDDGLVYANFNITGALTGRMSSSKPNLQQIPRKDFPVYREFFVPQYDVMLAPDVSQQEPRILGYLSKDDNLLKALNSGESVHVYVARMIYDDPTIVKDGKDPRYAVGKAINLAIGYGLTAVGLAEQTGLSETEAQKIIDKYFHRFPGVKYYMTKYRNMAWRDGYVTTPAGRRMYVNPYDFKSENNAINSPIQGGAADFTKLWASRIWQKSREQAVPFSLCMLVHDELVFDVQNEYKDATIKIIGDAMSEVGEELYPGIPFTSDMNQGNSWACHE